MKKFRFLLSLVLFLLIGCNTGEVGSHDSKSFVDIDLSNYPLEKLISFKRPLDLYSLKYGRFTLESNSKLLVRKGDLSRQFTGFSRLEMDKKKNFRLVRKPFFEENPKEVFVVGSTAYFKDRPKDTWKQHFPDREFLDWANASINEIYSAYEQGDFAETAKPANESNIYECYKNPSGELCLDKNTMLPIKGKYTINISGDPTSQDNTVLDLNFKIFPHPQSFELLLFNDK
ncbi:MAG: hypothetical protein KDD48_01490 [Bdellovibrionales bacterium]|nr:hypothetical protein [Bdellovibrionales bacterium]